MQACFLVRSERFCSGDFVDVTRALRGQHCIIKFHVILSNSNLFTTPKRDIIFSANKRDCTSSTYDNFQ